MKQRFMYMTLVLTISFFYSCSIKKMAMNQVANALSGSGDSNVFVTDNDPEFVGDALPFAIKMYETVMNGTPNHHKIRILTGSMYIMYANVYLQGRAELMPEDDLVKKEILMKRAKNLYLRGRDMILQMFKNKYPGFIEALGKKQFDKASQMVQKEDVEALYWASAGWVAAFSIDPFDTKLGITLPKASELMKMVLKLDENFNHGSVHDFYVLYYGSLPDYMGGSFDKAREHYKKAVKLSRGKSASPHMGLATTVYVKEQKVKEFKTLMDKVLEIDVDKNPSLRLQNIINQRKARFYLDNLEILFVEVLEDEDAK